MKKPEAQNEIVIYRAKDGRPELEVSIRGETLWLNLQQIADLFDRDKSVVSRHIRNIYATGELVSESTVAKNATVQKEGGRQVEREIEYYSLDVILSVGYRVNSKRGTQFRIWATQVLKDHLLIRHLAGGMSIQALRKRPHTCCISSSKITPLWMGTSGSGRLCSYGSWKPTAFYMGPKAASGWGTMRWWR